MRGIGEHHAIPRHVLCGKRRDRTATGLRQEYPAFLLLRDAHELETDRLALARVAMHADQQPAARRHPGFLAERLAALATPMAGEPLQLSGMYAGCRRQQQAGYAQDGWLHGISFLNVTPQYIGLPSLSTVTVQISTMVQMYMGIHNSQHDRTLTRICTRPFWL